jgi:hypothetical protein
MMTITYATAPEVFAAITEGTMLIIPGKKQPVRVTSVVFYDGAPSVYTTSGNVRPGSFAWGRLSYCRFHERLVWQATPQQQVRLVDSVQVAGLAN